MMKLFQRAFEITDAQLFTAESALRERYGRTNFNVDAVTRALLEAGVDRQVAYQAAQRLLQRWRKTGHVEHASFRGDWKWRGEQTDTRNER